jgi:hypothetical protein
MLLRYKPANGAHLKIVPLIAAAEHLKKIRLTRGHVSLLPGVNEVTDDEWSIMKVHLARELKDKTIVIIGGADADNKTKSLKEVSANAAYDLIDGCVNPDTLRKWFQEETREEIRLELIQRMEKLKIKPKARNRRRQETSAGDEDTPEAAGNEDTPEAGDEPAKEKRRGGGRPKAKSDPESELETEPERDDAA